MNEFIQINIFLFSSFELFLFYFHLLTTINELWKIIETDQSRLKNKKNKRTANTHAHI